LTARPWLTVPLLPQRRFQTQLLTSPGFTSLYFTHKPITVSAAPTSGAEC
jgi:hypothetical protein